MKAILLSILLALGIAGCSQPEKHIQVLIVGGGSSPDFDQWYRGADVATLEQDQLAEARYTDRVDSILPALAGLDVLVLTNNQPMEDPELRQSVVGFVESAKGLVLAHAATWYNWEDWPEYNRQLVGGGSRGHDPYGPFEVRITASHPITENVPEKFSLDDELYYLQADPQGAGMDVLAIGQAEGSQDEFPILWVTPHPQGRIVGFTLGHDGAAHELAAYKTILRNAVSWAAGKE